MTANANEKPGQRNTPLEPSGVREALQAGECIGDLKKRLELPKLTDLLGIPHLSIAEGQKLESLEPLMPRPRMISLSRDLHEVESFCKYVNAFKDKNTRLYGDIDDRTIRAVIDDNEAAEAPATGQEPSANPRWGRHHAVLILELSAEWNAWMEMHKKTIGHLVFVEFLQERLSNIAKPDASGILEAARAFSASRSAKFEQVLPLSGGDLSVSYSEDVRGTVKNGSAALPSKLTLAIRPFKTGTAYEVSVQIRWRLSREGELAFNMALLETDKVLETAFSNMRAVVENATKLKVLI